MERMEGKIRHQKGFNFKSIEILMFFEIYNQFLSQYYIIIVLYINTAVKIHIYIKYR